MIKLTNGLATMTLAAGLALGTAGAAMASTNMTGSSDHALMSTPISKLSVSQLRDLKGHEVFDGMGNHVGKILRLVRGQNTDQLYYVVKGRDLMTARNEMAAVPVSRLHWQGKEIVAAQKFPTEPPLDRLNNLPLWSFAYTGNTWSPHQG